MAKKLKYPLAMPHEAKEEIKQKKAKLKNISPEEFLNETEKMRLDAGDKAIITAFKKHIKRGHHLGPLKLYKNDIQDGRHRAEASKELGINEVPVLDFRDVEDREERAGGGSVYSSHLPPKLPGTEEDPEAAFRRLIEWSFAVAPLFGRHGHAAGGGVQEIDDAIRTARDIASRKEMEHEKGFSGNVEFAPLSVEEPLTHARLPLGSYPKDTTEVIQPALQTASEIAPYFTPAAPIAAARDVAVGLREGDPTNVVMSAIGLPGKAAKAAAIGASAFMPSEAEAGVIDKALKAIRGYHASPYKFEKFDSNKIGTGVGEQAFGHGHYIAEYEPEARTYLGTPEARYSRLSGHMSPKEEFAFDIASNANDPRDMDIMQHLVRKYGENISFDEAQKLANEAINKRGHMYEVGLHAEPQHFLDWNAPLKGQHAYERMRQHWDENLGDPDIIAERLGLSEHSTGKDLHDAIGGKTKAQAAADALNKAGIPGIKYIGQTSRPNYVVFDPEHLEIMRRYAKGGDVHLGYDLGGYVSESKDISSAASEVWKSDLDRLHEKMKEVQEDENKYKDGGSIVDHALEVLSKHRK
jgi:hypothetical protein